MKRTEPTPESVSRPRKAMHVAVFTHTHQAGWSRLFLAGAIVSVILAAVSFSAFTFARPLITTWLGDTGTRASVLSHGTIINRSVTQRGITLHLEQGFADASRTVLTMHITPDNGLGATSPAFGEMYLLDTDNHEYARISSTQLQGDALVAFLPLPVSELHQVQSLTLVVPSTEASVSSSGALADPWRITFQVHPQPGRLITFAQASQMHNGITIQPEQLDLGPSGMRLVVRFSGLNSDTSLFSLAQFATEEDDIGGCPPGANFCGGAGATSDGANLKLQGIDGTNLMPSWVAVQDEAASGVLSLPGADQGVSAKGSATLAFLFFTPLPAGNDSIQLNIDQVRLASVGNDSAAPERVVTGPWGFDLALRS